jgi:hypothetical protein
MEFKYSLCEEWQDFWKFVSDVKERPSEKHQLRRLDPHGNFCKENCKWIEIREDKDKAKYASDWRLKNPEKAKNIELRTRFGITLEDYSNIKESQNGVCAICGSKDHIALAVDHCHETKKVRGLLCKNCNTLLGNAKDKVEILNKAIAYLTK